MEVKDRLKVYRFRFEKIEQIFDLPENSQVVLPLYELLKTANAGGISSLMDKYMLIAEIPAVIWENRVEKIKEQLLLVKECGVEDALCENIGAINICKDLGLKVHGGTYLNVINSAAMLEYKAMGTETLTLSFEMPFGKVRSLLKILPEDAPKTALIIYGYLPLMKFRACPAMDKNGCKDCSRDKYLTDRKGERFRIFCRNSEYSELLNCVPLYASDKSVPDVDICVFYYTVEDKKECERIFRMSENKETPQFRRTAGLYGRELL